MKNEKTYELVLTALFTAIIVIMAFTPLGYSSKCADPKYPLKLLLNSATIVDTTLRP